MAAFRGKKPLIDKKLYDLAVKYLQNTDSYNVPYFVKKLEQKESYLAEHLIGLCKVIADTHAKRLKEEQGVVLPDPHKNSIALDLYVVGWFTYLVLDLARDSKFEEEMKSLYEAE